MQPSESKELYLSAFRQHQNNGASKNPAWLRQLRDAAIASFAELGFPTTHDEDWKYTSLDRITSVAFRGGNGAAKTVTDDVFALAFTTSACNRLVFINGCYFPQLSSMLGLPAGIQVASIAEVLQRNDEFLEPYLGRYARTREQAFVALNTALMDDGAFVRVPKNCKLEEPIHLIHVSSADGTAVASHPR